MYKVCTPNAGTIKAISPFGILFKPIDTIVTILGADIVDDCYALSRSMSVCQYLFVTNVSIPCWRVVSKLKT